MIENGGAYGLFCTVLADDVFVDAGLQVARVELGDAITRLEDGTSAGFLRRIIGA